MAAIEQITALLQAVRVESYRGFYWSGERITLRFPQGVVYQDSLKRQCLVDTLTECLYGSFYCTGFLTPIQTPSTRMFARLSHALDSANMGRGFWSKGWAVSEAYDDRVIVHRQGLSLNVPESSVRLSGSPSGNGNYEVNFPRGSSEVSPGFYVAFGDEGQPSSSDETIRIYLNVTARGSTELMEMVTRAFNREKIVFAFKVSDSTEEYSRCDSAVLYVCRDDFDRTAVLLSRCLETAGPLLKRGTPSLTKCLHPGVGLAEDPGGGQSYGEHRCKLIAEALVDAYEKGESQTDIRIERVRERFAQDGIDLAVPYLNSGSPDVYFLPGSLGGERARRLPDCTKRTSSTSFLSIAIGIADRLASDAFWNDDACTWLGPNLRRRRSRQRATDVSTEELPEGHEWKAIDSCIYDGASGVALFFAQAARHESSTRLARTARGAMTYALREARRGLDRDRRADFGLYTGVSGVALAGARVGRLLEDEDLQASARRLSICSMRLETPQIYELASGLAGAIYSLVEMYDLFRDDRFLKCAVDYGDRLLVSARRTSEGLYWSRGLKGGSHNPTGLSHGNAGIALAYLELYDATQKCRFRDAAEQALAYEISKSNADLAAASSAYETCSQRAKLLPLFWPTWCNGAPGMALPRLRAWEVLNDAQYKAEARFYLDASLQSLKKVMSLDNRDVSLCHGMFGIIDVLALGGASGVAGPYEETIASAAEGAANSYRDDVPWPCGTPVGETAGLMLGLAGIGYGFLRLADPSVRSVLMPRYRFGNEN